MGRIPQLFRVLGSAYVVLFGGFLTVSAAVGTLHAMSEAKKKKNAPRCSICKGKGFYLCELCNGETSIKWSPLHDPIGINPCVCPTCDGRRFNFFLNYSTGLTFLRSSYQLIVCPIVSFMLVILYIPERLFLKPLVKACFTTGLPLLMEYCR